VSLARRKGKFRYLWVRWICFLRSSAEKRAPKSEFKAEFTAEGGMCVAIHARTIGGPGKAVKKR
jgi:hypothetical protein